MNVKNFIVGGIVGGIIDFLLGWVFYVKLFQDFFPPSEGMNMTFIFLGCMAFGFFVSYLFSSLSAVSNVTTGLTHGALIGFFHSLVSNLFTCSSKQPDYNFMVMDIGIMIVIGACVGAGIAFTNQKLK
ncbi:MAG: hypothetical protein V4548_01530 [Bacteroidota bacterium]